MRFSQETLQGLEEQYLSVAGKSVGLSEAYVYSDYKDDRAKEYAKQGFVRRLLTMQQCIVTIFELLPPDQVDPPTNENLSNAKINLQAFVFNVFGCVDNLAWIWVHEKHITKENGSPIPNGWIGLRRTNKFVRKSLSQGFQDYLDGLDGWFDLQDEFRHALAHRIPLYIPQYVITDDKKAANQDLEDRKANTRNPDEYDRLDAEQTALGVFWPVMTHSFIEEANFVDFHPQLLADFNTIEELGRKMLEELDR